MKDSTMILVVAVMLAAAALPAIGTSLRQMAHFTDMMEQIRAATRAPSEMRAMVSSNRTVRLHSAGGDFRKGWFSL